MDNEYECYTLEDEDKLSQGLHKEYGVTAIPRGVYFLHITYSTKFRRKLPLIRSVPGFNGIRIHPGNTHKDTAGCILVGDTWVEGRPNFIGRSRAGFNRLFKKLEAAKKAGKEITIEVE